MRVQKNGLGSEQIESFVAKFEDTVSLYHVTSRHKENIVNSTYPLSKAYCLIVIVRAACTIYFCQVP